MTRKDYIILSSALADAHAQILAMPYIADQFSAMAGHRLACESLVDALRAANPRFNHELFLTACISAT